MHKRSLLFIGLALAAVLVVVVGRGTLRSLRGSSLLSDHDIAFSLKTSADADGDGILSAREIRRHLVRIIRGVALRSPESDINGDGNVNRGDTSAAVRVFRSLLLADCGNGTTDIGEACDDGETTPGDGCSATCAVEPGHACTGEPSICRKRLRSFAPKVDYPTGSGPWFLALEDINNDGKDDVVTANHDSDSISVLLNNGDGTLRERVDYPTGHMPRHVALGDLNGDEKADVIVSHRDIGGFISIFFNNGDGTFAGKVDYEVGVRGGAPFAAAIGDFNGDGAADIVTANYGSDFVSILLNNGDGTFSTTATYPMARHADFVAVEDLNGDGMADFAAVYSFGNTVSVFLNQGDGTFAPKVDYATGPGPLSVEFLDHNADGKLDLITANQNAHHPISLLRNNGDGTFASRVDFPLRFLPNSMAIGDIDGDGLIEFAFASIASNTVYIVLQNGHGPIGTSIVGGIYSVAFSDINGDGKQDLIVTNINNSVSVFLNNG